MSELLTTARPYAKALFKSAKEQNMIDENFDMLKSLNIVVNNSNAQKILLNNSFDSKYKVNFLSEVLKKNTNENFLRFISLLSENNRLFVIAEICDLYNSYLQEEKSLKTVKIDTAYELNNNQLKAIKVALEKRFNKKIEGKVVIDKSIVGGTKIIVGDTVIDASVRGQLDNLAYTLKA